MFENYDSAVLYLEKDLDYFESLIKSLDYFKDKDVGLKIYLRGHPQGLTKEDCIDLIQRQIKSFGETLEEIKKLSS